MIERPDIMLGKLVLLVVVESTSPNSVPLPPAHLVATTTASQGLYRCRYFE